MSTVTEQQGAAPPAASSTPAPRPPAAPPAASRTPAPRPPAAPPAAAAGAGGGWHGYLGDPAWPAPTCVTRSALLARPKHSDLDASEYLDAPEVLAAKVDRLVGMMRAARQFLVYAGAGISTAAGVGDYASRGAGSIVARDSGTNRLALQPTLSHRVLAALEKANVLQYWLQQNHDGLAQKAGFPAAKLNEIHGNWFDRKNPVVFMDGSLRPDLLAAMVAWCDKADLVLAIGTSLCGMNADNVAMCAAERHAQALLHTTGSTTAAAPNAAAALPPGGLVILNLQRTSCDAQAALRIFAKADTVMAMVQKKMRLRLDTATYSAYPPPMRYVKKMSA